MAVTPVKTTQTALLAWQAVNTATQAISSEYNCATTWGASFGIRLARQTGTAFTAGWPNVRIEASPEASGGGWIPLFPYQMAVGVATIVNTTLNGAINAAVTTAVLALTTGVTGGDILFLSDASTANYELVRVKVTPTNTTVTFEEATQFAHANAAQVTDQAEMLFPSIDLSTYKRLRVIVDNAGSGQNMAAQVLLTTFDSF